MNVIYERLKLDDIVSNNDEREHCLKTLNEILQSPDRDYETYLSSQAFDRTIVEEIGEIDADLSLLEKKLKKILVQNKEIVSAQILNETLNESLLHQLHENLEQLWEMDPQDIQGHSNISLEKKDDQPISVDELLETDDTTKMNSQSSSSSHKNNKPKDDFHVALDKLRKRINKKKNKEDMQENLTFILINLQNITDLMELPFLTRTCIRTGHYQEAIMVFSYSKSLKMKFPDSDIIKGIYNNILNEVSNTMAVGLVKLLSTNLSVNSIKKILNYLSVIPPFDMKGSNALLNVYLSMRYEFIRNEILSYSLDPHTKMNDSLIEMIIKRKIEVVREHLYSSLNIYSQNFNVESIPITIPLIKDITDKLVPSGNEDMKNTTLINDILNDEDSGAVRENMEEQFVEEQSVKDESVKNDGEKMSSTQSNEVSENDNKEINDEKAKYNDVAKKDKEDEEVEYDLIPQFQLQTNMMDTNPLMLQMVNKCINCLINEFQNISTEILNNSICLQLIYCSFRLNDLNINYHYCFLNRLFESGLFTVDQIVQAIKKRTELASRYS